MSIGLCLHDMKWCLICAGTMTFKTSLTVKEGKFSVFIKLFIEFVDSTWIIVIFELDANVVVDSFHLNKKDNSCCGR